MPGARAERHRFDLDGGTISLDFVNTVSGMRDAPNMRERLFDYGDLVYWAEQVGLIDMRKAAALQTLAQREPVRTTAAFAEAIRRREALHDVVLAAVDERETPATALAVVNAWVADALAHRKFRPLSPARFEAVLDEDGDLLSFLRPVALDAAELL